MKQGYRLFSRMLFASLGISACVPLANLAGDDDEDKGSDEKGGRGGSNSGTSSVDPACFECGDDRCSDEASACDSTDGCREMLGCLFGCDSTDAGCLVGCVPQDAEGVQAYSAAQLYYACTVTGCADACSPSSGGTGGGSGTGGATGGDAGTGGTSGGVGGTSGGVGGTSGASGGSAPTGGRAGMGGTAGSTGGSATGGTGGLTPGIHWLSIEGSWADPSADPNGALQISGALYPFADTCAQISYDPATRCVSGTLCDPGPTYANWGVAVGFDFHNTGAEGSPPDTKLPWNASAVGALGVAWEVSGSAPGLQVWLTNMDPIWNGMCSADDCGINGAPDGKASTLIGSQDTLYFTNMVKDNWGGSGTVYTFNRSNILAMQFKLAAIVSGATPFSFCIDRLGIIL